METNSSPLETNPMLEKQLQDQQAEIEDRRQQLAAEQLAIVKGRYRNWASGSVEQYAKNKAAEYQKAHGEMEGAAALSKTNPWFGG